MEGPSEATFTEAGVESDVLELLPDPPAARVRLRLVAFPRGDWLTVRVSAWLFDPAAARSGRFNEPMATGPEMDVTARSDWSVLDLPLPRVVRGEYAIAGKVFSADPRWRKPFSPSHCHVFLATFGSLVRVPKAVLEDIYSRGGYGNPAAEDEIKRWVREGVVVAVDDDRLWRAVDRDGHVDFEPMTPE